MAIKEILLPLVGEPSSAALRAIDKCIAVAGGLGARIIAIAVEEEIPVRPKVVISADIENAEARSEKFLRVSWRQPVLWTSRCLPSSRTTAVRRKSWSG